MPVRIDHQPLGLESAADPDLFLFAGPEHEKLLETYREVLKDVLDLPSLQSLLREKDLVDTLKAVADLLPRGGK